MEWGNFSEFVSVHGDYSLQENGWWFGGLCTPPILFCWRTENGFSVCEQLRWLCSGLFQHQSLCRVSFLSCQHVPSPGHQNWHGFMGVCSHLLRYDRALLMLKISAASFLSVVLYPIIFWKSYSQARFKTHLVDHMNADSEDSRERASSRCLRLLPGTFPIKIIFLLAKFSKFQTWHQNTSLV